MQRDQRIHDNWAWIYARERAVETQEGFRVIFCLTGSFLGATERHYQFMLEGLRQLKEDCDRIAVPFLILNGDPAVVIPEYVKASGAGLLVTDFNPLRIVQDWKRKVSDAIEIPFIEVDAHNVVPVRVVSDKEEYSAFTLRKKIQPLLSLYLVDFPPGETRLTGLNLKRNGAGPSMRDLPAESANEVNPAEAAFPGERAAWNQLNRFIRERLGRYPEDRNRPEADGQSGLSCYLHFGMISAQRVALEVLRSTGGGNAAGVFLEELIVRRELSDNFCLYNPEYDRVEGFRPWARKTLDRHRSDSRAFLYEPEDFERAVTHDPLWNAAQQEMMISGKMHGYLRMYWAKKILEWSASPDLAMAVAVWLNDKYQLDGRDPNGYAGIAWSIGGTHDRPWGERPVYGMIRYMNFEGCRRKFDVKAYIRKWLDPTGPSGG